VAVALAMAVVQAYEVARIEAAAKGAVDAAGDLRFVIAAIAQAAIEYFFLAAGQLRDVVDRATYRASAIKERRGAADQFDAVDHPGVHRTGGAAVAQVDAVEQLGDLVLGKATVRHEAAVARVGGGIDASHAVDHVLGILGAPLFDHETIGHTDRSRRFTHAQPQPRAGFHRLIKLQPCLG